MKSIAQLFIALAMSLAVKADCSEPGPDSAEVFGHDAFRFVAAEVARSETTVQREFASVVLLQLAEVYFGEAGLARRQAETDSSGKQPGLRLKNWALGVEREAQRYLRLHDAARNGAEVKVSSQQGSDSSLMLVVGTEAILPGHPRPSQQAHLETSILADFCRRVDCLTITGDSKAMPRLSSPLPGRPD